MKKRDKMKGKKGYAILALVIAISFITVLTWNNLVQADPEWVTCSFNVEVPDGPFTST